MPRPPELSVVIPVYGSATILPALAERLEDALTPALGAGNFEVVLVHDNGPDNAWEVIRALSATRPWLRGLDLRRNAGQHNAIMAGLAAARGHFLVTMDDDLQHDPDDVSRILDALRGGADLVYAQFPQRRHALWKRAGSRFNDRVAQWLLGKPADLYLSPFRGFVRGLRDEVLRYQGPFVYVDGLLLQSTSPHRIATLTVTHHARSDGRSGYSLRKSVSLWLQMATSFSIVPLRLVSFAGALASCVAFLVAIVVLIQKLRHPELPVGWASLILSILFMGGLQLLALGAIGEYTGRVLLNVNKRPQYVVGDTVNVDEEAGSP
jgi:undecaprenyl-phosphate 4-deoxy-4-formamido-L-arabinose transferase